MVASREGESILKRHEGVFSGSGNVLDLDPVIVTRMDTFFLIH